MLKALIAVAGGALLFALARRRAPTPKAAPKPAGTDTTTAPHEAVNENANVRWVVYSARRAGERRRDELLSEAMWRPLVTRLQADPNVLAIDVVKTFLGGSKQLYHWER